MQGFIILAIIGTEKLIVTKIDIQNDGRTEGQTEIRTPISHFLISRRDHSNNNNKNNIIITDIVVLILLIVGILTFISRIIFMLS